MQTPPGGLRPQPRRATCGNGACLHAIRPRRGARRGVVLAGGQSCSSSETPPWSIRRRASERDIPNASAISPGRWTTPSGASNTSSSICSGAPRCDEYAIERLLGLHGLLWRVQPADQLTRERTLGLARRQLVVELPAKQQPVVLAHRLIGDAQRLAVHLLGRRRSRRCGCQATWTSSARRRCRRGSASS